MSTSIAHSNSFTQNSHDSVARYSCCSGNGMDLSGWCSSFSPSHPEGLRLHEGHILPHWCAIGWLTSLSPRPSYCVSRGADALLIHRIHRSVDLQYVRSSCSPCRWWTRYSVSKTDKPSNRTDNRIYIGNTTIGNAEQLDGDPLILGDSGDSTRPYGENGQISLVTEDDCATYLVMTGSGSVYGWWSAPTNDDSLPKPVAWYGDNGEANSAIRLDKLNVTRRGYVR